MVGEGGGRKKGIIEPGKRRFMKLKLEIVQTVNREEIKTRGVCSQDPGLVSSWQLTCVYGAVNKADQENCGLTENWKGFRKGTFCSASLKLQERLQS